MAKKRLNGEGTIWQNKKGLWRGELTIGYNDDNTRIKKTFSSKDPDVVKKKMDDEKYKLNRNIIIQNSDYTVVEWVQFWLENYKVDIKSKTYDNYEYALNKHIKGSMIGDVKISKIKPEMMQQFFNSLSKKGLSTSTIKKSHIALNQAFTQAIVNELMYINPCQGTKVPKIEKRKAVAMTPEEEKQFLNCCDITSYGNFFIYCLRCENKKE